MKKNESGFTLLEVLVVIVILVLLLGITFRLSRPTTAARDLGDTTLRIRAVDAAIAEFHAEYGIFPPATAPVSAKYSGFAEDATHQLADVAPGAAMGYPMPYRKSIPGFEYLFGLTSFLVDRRGPVVADGPSLGDIYAKSGVQAIWSAFGQGAWPENSKGLTKPVNATKLMEELEPSERDRGFFKRVRPFFENFLGNWGDSRSYFYFSVRDVWGRDLLYICPPPYTTYALFSAGPDGKVVASDPLNREAACPRCGQYHNRDNVYGSVDDRAR